MLLDERLRSPVVEVVVPVYNEVTQLAESVEHLRHYLDESFPFRAVVTIVDNGSTDDTSRVAFRLAGELEGVRVVRLPDKGRGRALRAAWSASDAQVAVYTDVDLSTSLDALLPLVAPILSGHSDLAIGSRLAPGARVVRGAKRELISRTYNAILKTVLGNGFSDAQCGFKAIRTDVARDLLPLVDDESWFFDTELLVLAERSGLRIHEVPVDWVDDPDSRVHVVKTAGDDLKGVVRLLLHPRTALGKRQVTHVPGATTETALSEVSSTFARIGLVSTFVYALAFLVLRVPLGNYVANVVSVLACTVANTSAHLRVAGTKDREATRRLLVGTVAGLGSGLALTIAALAASSAVFGSGWMPALAAVLVATAIAAVVRFSVIRTLVFRAHVGSKAARS